MKETLSTPPTAAHLQLKPGEANLRLSEDTQLLLDGEGRLTGFYDEERLIRRSYDDRWLLAPRIPRSRRSGVDGRSCTPSEETIRGTLDRIHADLDSILTRRRPLEVTPSRTRNLSTDPSKSLIQGTRLLSNARGWDRESYRSDGARLRELVGAIPVLPPDQYRSLYLLVSRGCRYNRCLFCELYRDRPFQNLDPPQVEGQAAELLDFLGEALPTRTSVFLGDASGLSVPQPQLVEILSRLHSMLPPSLTRPGFFTFTDVFVTNPRNERELRALADLGLRRIYIGLESASPPVLAFFQKPQNLDVMKREILKARDAGIHCALMVIVGGAGKRHQQDHITRTLDFLHDLDLTKQDRIFLSPFVLPKSTGYAKRTENLGFEALEPQDLEKELTAFRTGLSRSHARVSHYELRDFLYR